MHLEYTWVYVHLLDLHSPKMSGIADRESPADMLTHYLPADVLPAVEDNLRAAGRRAPAAVALWAPARPRPLRHTGAVITRHRIPPVRSTHTKSISRVPVHCIQVRAPLHVRTGQLLHVLLVQALLPLRLRHVKAQDVEETHLKPSQNLSERVCALHQAVGRHMQH